MTTPGNESARAPAAQALASHEELIERVATAFAYELRSFDSPRDDVVSQRQQLAHILEGETGIDPRFFAETFERCTRAHARSLDPRAASAAQALLENLNARVTRKREQSTERDVDGRREGEG